MMNEEIQNLKKEMEELKNWKQSLEASNSIPVDIDFAFRERFIRSLVDTSTKTQASGAKLVNEAGSAAPYNVQNLADGYLQIYINGVTYYIPYYSTL